MNKPLNEIYLDSIKKKEKLLIKKDSFFNAVVLISCILGAIIILFFSNCGVKPARAEEINIEKLANAIYYAEGGSKTSHPYGILSHYKHTTPRQACINTIKHALKDYNKKEDFIVFLGNRYCPVGAKNDPMGLNKNWVKNVRRIYEKICS